MKIRTLVVSCALTLAGCEAVPQVRVAVDVDNRSTDAGQPDSTRMQLYCDGALVVDAVLGNVFSGPPYRNSQSFGRHWLLVRPGQHRLRVLVPAYALILDTALVLNTQSFTSINLHHHLRAPDTLRDAHGSPVYVVPADTTCRITLSQVPFDRVP